MQVRLTTFISLLCFLCSCNQEIVPEPYQPKTDHEAYQLALGKMGLGNTALAKDWMKLASSTLQQSIKITLPYREAFYFSNHAAEATTYSFEAKRGSKVLIEVKPEFDDELPEAILFLDLFRIDTEAAEGYVHVASADRTHNQLAFEPRHDAIYLLRMQPELLRGGNFEITIHLGPALEFPVLNGNNPDIGSFFGDPRDGGRRKHHGIDIFAKRHTPIIAPCDGYIRFVGERGLGGKVVWMRDHERNMTLYFAHLQDIIALDDTWVKTGDTLGTVGNTGNARTTPPHLHFGIYRDGPIDPYYFVAKQRKRMNKIVGDRTFLGASVRTKRKSSFMHLDNGRKSILPRHQWLQIHAVSENKYRANLPDGQSGLISCLDIEPLSAPIGTEKLSEKFDLKERAASRSHLISKMIDQEEIKILARDKTHYFVETSDGLRGWMSHLF